jgi:uncharacterized protein (DUF2336 family)
MIVRRYLLWARTAGAGQRAAAISFLAEAWLRSDMSPDERREADTAMLSALDDASPLVRRALAETLCAERAPRAIVLGLVQDQPDIAALMLAHSPVLTDADLVDAAAVGGELVQVSIAQRQDLSIGAAAALAEVGCAHAVAAMLSNPAATIAERTVLRAAERFGAEPCVREALLKRYDLPIAIRHRLAAEVAGALRGWLSGLDLMRPERAERITRDAGEKVAVRLAAEAGRSARSERELAGLVAHLRATRQLTPGLILRSMLAGETALAEAALADLAGVPLARAADILHDRRGHGVAALCRKARIPENLIPAFTAAAEAVREIGAPASESERARIARRIIERVLIACVASDAVDHDALMALLRRFEAEAAREEAQEIAQSLADDAALAALLEIDPELIALDEPAHERQAA